MTGNKLHTCQPIIIKMLDILTKMLEFSPVCLTANIRDKYVMFQIIAAALCQTRCEDDSQLSVCHVDPQ